MSLTDDIIAIQQLLARYNRAADAGDADAFAATFTDDGETVTPDATRRGREALMEAARTVPQRIPGIRHWVTNHVVDVDGDEASATVYVMVVVAGGAEGPQVAATGKYRDRLRRTPDGWRFTRREYTPDT